MKNQNMLLVLALFFLGGCTTATFDTRVDGNLPFISGAVTIAVSAKDTRAKEAIGKIALDVVKVKQSDFEKAMAGEFKDYLYSKSLNVVPVERVNLAGPAGVRETLTSAQAKGLLYAEIHALHVESFDIILDEPKYDLSGLVILYDETGKSVFNSPLSGTMGSRALDGKATGETLIQLLKMAMLDVTTNPKFEKALSDIVIAHSSEAELNTGIQSQT